MICANPDLMAIRHGIPGISAGSIGKHYEKLGGRVVYFGKPHRSIYDYCLTKSGPSDKKRVLAIGDALATDILGASNFGIDSLLVGSGIDADLFNNWPAIDASLRAATASAGACPAAVMLNLNW